MHFYLLPRSRTFVAFNYSRTYHVKRHLACALLEEEAGARPPAFFASQRTLHFGRNHQKGHACVTSAVRVPRKFGKVMAWLSNTAETVQNGKQDVLNEGFANRHHIYRVGPAKPRRAHGEGRHTKTYRQIVKGIQRERERDRHAHTYTHTSPLLPNAASALTQVPPTQPALPSSLLHSHPPTPLRRLPGQLESRERERERHSHTDMHTHTHTHR
jgi:hypothetical protein